MLKIGIVVYDDTKREEINDIIDEVLDENFLGNFQYHRYPSLNRLMESDEIIDIMFLDVQNQKDWKNDVLSLQHIKKIKSLFVMISCFDDIQDAIELGVLQVFHRENEKLKIQNRIREALNRSWFYTMQGKYLCIDDIHYIEYRNRQAMVYMEQGSFVSKVSLRQWEERLKGKDFIRINRFVIVNVKKCNFHKQNVYAFDGKCFKRSKVI